MLSALFRADAKYIPDFISALWSGSFWRMFRSLTTLKAKRIILSNMIYELSDHLVKGGFPLDETDYFWSLI